MIKKIQMVAAALGVLTSGYALAEAPPHVPALMPLPIVQDQPDSRTPLQPLDSQSCEQSIVVKPTSNSQCGAIGGGGNIAFVHKDGDRAIRCAFTFVNDSRTLLEKAEFPYILTSARCLTYGADLDLGRTMLNIEADDYTRHINYGIVDVSTEVSVIAFDSESNLALLRINGSDWLPAEEICLNPLAPIPLGENSRATSYATLQNADARSEYDPEGYTTELFTGFVESANIRWAYSDGTESQGFSVLAEEGGTKPGWLGGGVFDERERYIGAYAGTSSSNCARKFVGSLHDFSGLRLLTNGPNSTSRIIPRGGLPIVKLLWLVRSEDGESHWPEWKQIHEEEYHKVEVPAGAGLYLDLKSCTHYPDHSEYPYVCDELGNEMFYKHVRMQLVDENGLFVAGTKAALGRYGGEYIAEFLARGTYYVKLTNRAAQQPRGRPFGLAASLGSDHQTTALPMFLAPTDSRMGFLRVINDDPKPAFIEINRKNVDSDPITVPLRPREARHFNALDLQDGNPDKQINVRNAWGALPTDDPWSLEARLAWDVDVLAYARTADGMVAPIAAEVPLVKDGENDVGDVFFFNPASNYNQRSTLRITNLIHPRNVTVRIEGMDDAGNVSNVEVSLYDNDWSTVTLTAADLEEGTGPGVSGALGDGVGKWRLRIVADPEATGTFYEENPVARVVNLLESPTGHLINLSDRSSQPSAAEAGKVVKEIPLFLAVSEDRMGFLRLANGSAEAAQVTLTAIREDGTEAGSVRIPLEPNEARHFNARDLQEGSPAKGIAEDDGFGELEDGENWRLRLESESDFEAQAYSRTADGLVADTTQAVARGLDGDQDVHRIAFFNPGSNNRQRSLLQVTNLIHPDVVTLRVEGMDDAGIVSSVEIRLEERETTTLSAADLEQGMGRGVTGALHDGQGKWRLKLTTDSEGPAVRVMNLLESPTGHLINLSN